MLTFSFPGSVREQRGPGKWSQELMVTPAQYVPSPPGHGPTGSEHVRQT